MPSSPGVIRRAAQALAGPAVLVLLVVAMLHTALFSGGRLVPTRQWTDLHTQFAGWRYFGFTQWKSGHFPFWNPHLFCGIPFFAQMQSSLLYPICWIYFFLDVGTGANLEIAANLSLAALNMYFWSRSRAASRCAATLAGAAFAFSAPLYLRVMAGHLSPLATIAWLPLGFFAIDRLLAERYLFAILLGALAYCLQWLGGSPQYVYYGTIIGGLYLILQSIRNSRALRMYAGYAAMCALGAMLAAVQIIPSVLASNLSIRAGGTSYLFASTFSLPPENLLTIFIPYPLGDMHSMLYLGRWHLWETSLYLGLCVFVLACIGLAIQPRKDRWALSILLLCIIILSLGSLTPVHHFLYTWLPGFHLFRGASKFGICWTLLLSILAAHGWDRIRRAPVPRWILPFTGIGAILCIIAAILVRHFDSPTGPVAALLRMIFHSDEFYANPEQYFRPNLLQEMTRWISQEWSIAAVILAAMTLLFYARRFSIDAAYLVLLLAIAELFTIAAESNTLSPGSMSFPQEWSPAVIDAAAHDRRVLYADSDIYGISADFVNGDSLWGYDPGQPKRYTELIAASQNQHPVSADLYDFQLRRNSPIFRLLRCSYLLGWPQPLSITPIANPLPHLLLLGSYEKISDPPAILNHLTDPHFDFAHRAILETDPGIAPALLGATGAVHLLHQSINDLEIEADLPAPALLLITDAYAPGWRVRPLEKNSSQVNYQILRADDVLRAIPLAPGHHHFDLYYIAPGFASGAILSLSAIVIYLAIFLIHRRRSMA